MILWHAVSFFMGGVGGALFWSWLLARDESLVKLQSDEVVIKRPLPDYVLVQVPPNIARQIVNSWGKTDPATGEARSIYANRYIRAQRIADSVEKKMPETV